MQENTFDEHEVSSPDNTGKMGLTAQNSATNGKHIDPNSSSANQRPSRKAKTKEAVAKYRNRDVELLVEEKGENRENKKAKVAQKGFGPMI